MTVWCFDWIIYTYNYKTNAPILKNWVVICFSIVYYYYASKNHLFSLNYQQYIFGWSSLAPFPPVAHSVLSVPKSTQWDQIAHSCLLWSDTGKVACLSQTTISGAVRWTWNKCTLNRNQIFSAHHLCFIYWKHEKKTNNPEVEKSTHAFPLLSICYTLPI